MNYVYVYDGLKLIWLSSRWHQWVSTAAWSGHHQHHYTHVSKSQLSACLIFPCQIIGDIERPSHGASSGAFPIRMRCRKWSPFPCPPLDWSAVSRFPSRSAPSASPAPCLLRPPSYWLLEAAATTEQIKTPTMTTNGFSRRLRIN